MSAVVYSSLCMPLSFSIKSESPCVRFNCTPVKLNFIFNPSAFLPSFVNEFFNQSVKQNSKTDTANQALLGTLAIDGAGVIGDLSGSVRQTFETYHKVYGTENPVALNALGFTTGFSAVSGGNSVIEGLKDIRTADKVSDTAGQALARLKVVRGGVQAVGGVVYIPERALSIASLFTSAKIVSTVAGVLGMMGGAFFGIVSIVAAIGTGIRLDEQRKFRAGLNAILKNPDLPEEMRSKKALEHLKQLATVSSEEKEQIRNEILALPVSPLPFPESISERVEDKANVLLQKKEAELKRLVDDDCLSQIRQKGLEEAESIIQAVQKKSDEKVTLAWISMALLVAGFAATILSYIFTGPVGILVTTGIGLATSVGWLLTDGHGLIKDFQSSNPGRYDKLWILLSTVGAVVTIALVFFLSGGIAPIIAAAVVGTAWIAINAACYYRLSKVTPHP